MDSLHSVVIFDTNWIDLPSEIKLIIIKLLPSFTRTSLRACSTQDRLLVDSVLDRKIHNFRLANYDNSFEITIIKTVHSPENNMKFLSFAEFQETLTAIMRKTDCIKEMEVIRWTVKNELSLSVLGRLVRVEKLDIYPNCINTYSVLKQVDTNHLKELQLRRENLEPEIFDLPQVTNADILHIGVNLITINQLLNFKCFDIELRNTKNLTSSELNQFIQSCALNLDEKPIAFQIQHAIPGVTTMENVMFDSPSSKLQLEVRYIDDLVKGQTNCKTADLKRKKPNDENNFRSVEYIQISGNEIIGKSIVLREKDKAKVYYKFSSSEDLHNKLAEIIGGIDDIEELELNDALHDWNLCAPKNRNLTIRKLRTRGNGSIDYLKIIEPRHLEDIYINGRNDSDESIYDTPQVVCAMKLEFFNCSMQDDQLLKLEAVNLMMRISENRCNLTDSGINKFLKKRLQTLNRVGFNLAFDFPGIHEDSPQIIEGFEIVKKESYRDRGWKIFVDSPHPNFQMQLIRHARPERDVLIRAELVRKNTNCNN